MQEILKVTDVNFERSDFSLNNISFKIYSGDIVGLIGENGAGKTTLFNVIFKNLEPSNGEISFLGDQHTKTDKSEMAIILDKNHFNASFTAIDINSIFSKVFKNWNKELFFSYIKEFDLPKDKKINDYSHGMKVKLNFAFAFCRKPKLLLLDEATNGLDPVFRNTLLSYISDFSKETGCAVFISSHILSDLEKITNKVLYLRDGKITEENDLNNLEKIMMGDR